MLTPLSTIAPLSLRRWPGATWTVEPTASFPQNGSMVARSRKWSAVTALVAMMLPWPAAVGLALHEAEDHHVAAHADLVAVLHGHEHAAGTPVHEHSLLLSPSSMSQWRVYVAGTVTSESVSLRELALPPPVIERLAPSATASPPAGSPSSKSVLRI